MFSFEINWPQIAVGVGAFALLALALIRWVFPLMERRFSRDLDLSYLRVTGNVQAILDMLTEERPALPSTLEEEISDVSGTLTRTVTRLRDISAKAQAFETEVHELVRRADAAQATAQLNEEQAQKIALLLTTQTEQKLKVEMEKLTTVHKEQIEGLKKAGSRSAWVTFVLGALVGFLLNLLSSAIMG